MKHPNHYDTDKKTSVRMSHVHLKRGKAEDALAKKLWHMGYRYRRNYKGLPGSPDIVITSKKICVFIDGEFWHGKDHETLKSRPGRNKKYWNEKIEENISRDDRDDKKLELDGWTVIRFWEKDVLRDVDSCVNCIEETLLEKATDSAL